MVGSSKIIDESRSVGANRSDAGFLAEMDSASNVDSIYAIEVARGLRVEACGLGMVMDNCSPTAMEYDRLRK